MSIIDQLIQIKKSSDTNDIVNMLDDFTLYGRLSKIPALSDISKSATLKKKLPLLSKAVEGDIYCLSLYMVAANITAYLGYEIPETITTYIDRTPESLRQKLIIAQENTMRVDYQSLDMYQHNTMREDVTAIYINTLEADTRIVIITRSGKMQRIFQGAYVIDKELTKVEPVQQQKPKSLMYEDERLHIKISNYSLQGNNAYFFAHVKIGKLEYHMMLDDVQGLLLFDISGKGNDIKIPMSIVSLNRINMSKSDPQLFIDSLAHIINEAV